MLVALDTETLLIAPGLQHPPIVCLSGCAEGGEPWLVPTHGARETFLALLSDPSIVTVWHNCLYDFGCAVAWWPDAAAVIDRAVEENRVLDTMLIERLAEIGGLTNPKDLSLANLHQAHGLGVLPKDAVRTSYGPLYGRPLEEYSPEQVHYAKEDAAATLRVLGRQLSRWGREITPDKVTLAIKRLLPLADARAYGMRVNPAKLGDLEKAATEHLTDLRHAAQIPVLLEGERLPPAVEQRLRTITGVLSETELRRLNAVLDDYRILRSDGTKNMARLRALVREAYDGRPPMTEEPRRKKGAPPRKKPFVPQVKTARAVLEESGDPRLESFANYGEWASIEKMVIPALSAGTRQPLHTKWRIVDSMRISSSAPNLTNLRTKAGIRECIVPRPGYCFLAGDHEGLENATLAQECATELRRTGLADFYNARGNLHCLVAAEIHGCTYEEALALKKADDPTFLKGPYKCAKFLNFGRPGGAGWRKLQFIAKQMGHLDWTEAETKRYMAAHAKAVPDLQAYLQWVSRQPHDERGYHVRIPGTTIMRRGITYCSACNNGFQALGAVVQIHVGWALRRAYLHGHGPLADCHVVNHVHDEWIFECPLSIVHEAAEELESIMVTAPAPVMPDVHLRAEVVAMAYWSKSASRVVRDGRLQVWPLWCDACKEHAGLRQPDRSWACSRCGKST